MSPRVWLSQDALATGSLPDLYQRKQWHVFIQSLKIQQHQCIKNYSSSEKKNTYFVLKTSIYNSITKNFNKHIQRLFKIFQINNDIVNIATGTITSLAVNVNKD